MKHHRLLPCLLLLACAGKGADDSSASTCPEGQPCITITSPADGSTIPTCLDMTVRVTNLTIVSPADHDTPVDGEGHWQMEINERPLLIPCEDLECRFTLDGFDDGPVSVVAVLADNTYVKLTDADGAFISDSGTYTLAGDGVVCP